ncbi:MAG TPA: hypothetical protein VH481_04895, partial [Nitrososphaeraceae archaeon]
SRRKRIARGSGVAEHDVKDLIKNFNNSKSMIKQSKGRQMQGMLRRLGIEEEKQDEYGLGLAPGYCRRLKFTGENTPVVVQYLRTIEN